MTTSTPPAISTTAIPTRREPAGTRDVRQNALDKEIERGLVLAVQQEDAMPAPTPPAATLDQYKAYMTDVGNIGSRYTTAQTFYLSVVSALIGIVTFVAKDAGAFQKYLWAVTAFITFFTALLCYIWWRTLDFYSHLFKAKFTVLKKMETGSSTIYPIFTDEWAELENSRSGTLIYHEKLIPILIGLAAVVAMLSVIRVVFS